MKAPVGLLSDRTVLRSKMEGLCPDKFQFAERSNESPSGTFKRQQMEGPCPDKFAEVYPLSAKRPFPLLRGEPKRPLFIFSGIPVVSCRSVS